MAFDETLAERIRTILQLEKGFSEKKMFGGICFMLNKHMTAGVVQDKLMLRVGPDQYKACLKQSHASPMNFTGKPMKGMIYISPAAITTQKQLTDWLNKAIQFTSSLPPK